MKPAPWQSNLVRKGGLEPPCLSAPPPQDGVSANFTTSALGETTVSQKYSKEQGSETHFKFVEGAQFQQMLAVTCRVNYFMFKYPGMGVMNEHCMQAGCKSGIDVGLGTVANHPGGVRRQLIFLAYRGVGVRILLARNFNRPATGVPDRQQAI